MEENCGEGQCCQTENNNCCGEYDKLTMIMGLVKQAKIDLIYEKVKKKLDIVDGKKFDKIAELLVEAVTEIKKDKQTVEKKREELREKFEEIFKKE